MAATFPPPGGRGSVPGVPPGGSGGIKKGITCENAGIFRGKESDNEDDDDENC